MVRFATRNHNPRTSFVCEPDQLAEEFSRELEPDLANDPVFAGTIAVAARYIVSRKGGNPDWSCLDVRGLFLALSAAGHCDVEAEVAVDVARILHDLYEWLGKTGRLDAATAQRLLNEIEASRDAFVGRVFVDKKCFGWERLKEDLELAPLDPNDDGIYDDDCPICRAMKEEFSEAPRYTFEVPEIKPCN